jgi:exodeoxyribonuclease VII large subunit
MIATTEEVYTVSRLNREVRFLLENNFAILYVEGEISNFVAPQSGHWYFGLKDSNAQVRCAMFKPQNRKLGFTPKDGMHVVLKARVSLYEGRGDFQLLAEYMEEAGEGKLRQQFEALKKRLAAEGLFDEAHKKPLPAIPQCIGVITSATGAAIRDILIVLKRRFAAVPVIIYPTLVQGETAAPAIVKAIQIANQRKECDVLILARGGGSLEDLWPFNEEQVAYAIYQSELPIVCGVGHEIDITIADFVADLRAPTPSAAAELIVPDKEQFLQTILHRQKQLVRQIKTQFNHFTQNITWVNKQLQQQHPKRRLLEKMQQLDVYYAQLSQLLNAKVQNSLAKLATLRAQIMGLTPRHRIMAITQELKVLTTHLRKGILQSLQNKKQITGHLAAQLDTLSPLSTLQRGFAIAISTQEKAFLRSAKQVHVGDKVNVRLAEGELECTVDKAIF